MVLLQVSASLDPNNEVSYRFSTFLPIAFVVWSSLDRPESLCPLHLQPTLLHLQPPYSRPFLLRLSETSWQRRRKLRSRPLLLAGPTRLLAGSLPAAAADKAIVATAAADVKDNTKGTSTEFQAFISDLEASPPLLNPLCHASAGHGCNTSDRQEEELPANKGKETLATVSAKASFAGLFSTNRRLTMDNKLSKFQIDEGTITLESNDLTDVQSKLGFCIVGYVAGKFPGLQAIRTLSKSWGASFQRHDSGWLVFRFARDDDRQRILDGGPYFIYGRPLLQSYADCFEFKEDDISLTPVWAILPSLPLECWHPNALGKIGSRLGTPIAMDSLTMRMERVSYARILVEVDASKTLVDHVEFKMPNGVTRRQPVVYEYTPKFCTECNRFGHHQNLCHDRQQPASATAIATVAVESKQKQSNEATEQKLKQGVTVTERKQQQTVTETADVAAHERPESSKQRMSLKERRHRSPLRQKEAEVDTSAPPASRTPRAQRSTLCRELRLAMD
ncbi:UNVERIFIED_CONTAM: hypothetical protein Scaly_2028700 [Sesamum calycinum]|uniref:DUF4283 domain-containing protein n=1 Tax=Sesamum calycinum TaxID=2727403 RepID=A0AAW2N4T6_9LAMI